MSAKADLHNRIATEMIMKLRDALEQDATIPELLVIGESVIVGMALVCIKLGGDNTVLDVMFDRAKERLAEIRLKNIKPGGTA